MGDAIAVDGYEQGYVDDGRWIQIGDDASMLGNSFMMDGTSGISAPSDTWTPAFNYRHTFPPNSPALVPLPSLEISNCVP